MIRAIEDLAALLRPVDLAGRETIRFTLANFRSAVTRELLTIRVRRQAEVFGTGDAPVDARISADGAQLEVDAQALLAANAVVAARMLAGADGALHFLRLFARTERTLAATACAFQRELAHGEPSLAAFLAYIDVNTIYQELGALKFCMAADLRDRVAALVPGTEEALLAPERPSLWMTLHLRELALARARLRGPASRYARLLRGYRRAHGYLGAEDVDFAAAEREEAIDARVAPFAGAAAITAAFASVYRAIDAERARRRLAAARFAAARPDPTLVALVLLARTLAAHEDRNRRAKMRLLRDLRDLAARATLPIETVTLCELAASCRDAAKSSPWQTPESC